MRTFNVRLAAILLAITVVFGVGVYFLHGVQLRRNAGFFLEQADRAKEQAAEARKKSDKAAERKAIQEQLNKLSWFIRLAPADDPRAIDASESFGMLMADNIRDSSSYTAAFNSLERVVLRDPDRIAARKKLIELWMLGERYRDAREHIEHILRKTPDDPEMLTLLGRCQAALGENKKAKASYLNAIKFSPQQVDAYYLLAMLLKRRPELCDKPDPTQETPVGDAPEPSKEKAVENTPASVMARLIEKNPESAKAHRFMCRYLLTTKSDIPDRNEAFKSDEADRTEALKHAEKSLELTPDDRESILLATQCGLATKDFEAASKYATQGLDKEKENQEFRRQMYFLQADAEFRAKNRERALEVLQKGFKETKFPRFLWVQADLQIDTGDVEGAKASLKQLALLNFDDRGLEYLRGKINLTQSHWRDASLAFENARPYFTNQPDQLKLLEYWLGVCYGHLRNIDQQTNAFQRALAIDPFFGPAQQGLTEAFKSANKIDEAIGAAVGAVGTAKDSKPVLMLVGMLIEKKRRLPKDAQRWEEVEKLLDEAEKKFPDLAQIPLSRCEVLVAQNRPEDAEKMVRGFLEKDPKNIQYWNALVILSIMQKKWDQTENTLALLEKELGDTVELRLNKANYYAKRYGAEAAPRLKALEENLKSFDDRQQGALWAGLLNFARMVGDREEIQRLSDRLIEKDPGNLQIHSMRFDQAYDAGDVPGMEKVLQDIERVEGKGPVWLRGQAALRSHKVFAGGDPALLDESLALLEQAKEIRPNWSKIPLMMGQIIDQKKDPVRALKFYQDAIDLGDYHPVAVWRVVQILYKQQRYKEANDLLHRLDREQAPFTLDLTKFWVELLLNAEIHDYDLALEKARKAVAGKADNYKDSLWLGQVLGIVARQKKAAGRKAESDELAAEAEKAFRRAVDAGADTPETWVAMIQFMASADKLSEAETVLDEARKKIAGKEAPLALAQCYEVLKKNEQAKEQYQLALAADPNSPRVTRIVADFSQRTGDVKQAEALWNRIIEGKEVKGETDDVCWARRNLALIFLTRFGYENVEQARKLVAANLAALPNSAADKRLMASIDSRDPKASSRIVAIQSLEELMKNQQATAADLYGLARLYLANKDWNSASELLRKLAVGASEDPQYLAIYIRELLGHGEISDAEVYLRQLEEKWPNYVQTILLQSELLVRQGKAEEALDLMKSFVDRPNAIPADRSQRIRLMALAMEDFVQRVAGGEQTVDTERFLRTAGMYQQQYADEHPSAAMELVAFFARQKRFDDAVNFLEQSWKSADPVSLAQACIKVVDEGRGAKEVVEQVMKILAEAKQHFENHPAILLTLGDINMGRGQYPEAEGFYRAILKDNAGHAVAMNNLAVMLSLTRKNPKEALELINKAMGITGPMAQMLDTRACVYVALEQGDKALVDMNNVIADGKTPERLFHQAQALELAGQKNNAAVVMQEALEMGLEEKRLLKPEVSAFLRLQKMAEVLSPPKKGDRLPK